MWSYICSLEGCAPLGEGDLGGRRLLWELLCLPPGGQARALGRFRQLFGEKPLHVETSSWPAWSFLWRAARKGGLQMAWESP